MKRFVVLLAALAATPVFGAPNCRAQDQKTPDVPISSVRPVAPLVARQEFELMMDALKDDDHNAFISMGTPEFQRAITKTLFEQVAAQVGPHAKEGFKATFLERLKNGKANRYVWKIEFKDGGDDVLAQMTVQDDKVAGFFLA